MLRVQPLKCAMARAPHRWAAPCCGTFFAAQPRVTGSSVLYCGQRWFSHSSLCLSPLLERSATLRLPTCMRHGSACGLKTSSPARLLHTTSATPPTTSPSKQRAEMARGQPEAVKRVAADEPTSPADGTQRASSHATAAAAKDVTDMTQTNAARASKGADAATPAEATASSPEDTKGDEKEEKEESWWRRTWRAFKSEGKDFSLFYLPFYPGTFVLLYAAFATEALHKESILDYVLNVFGDYVDRKKMYARVEAWNTWANIGFAFIINELLEVVRFPVIVILYYATKPYSTRFAHWMLKFLRPFRRAKSKSEKKS